MAAELPDLEPVFGEPKVELAESVGWSESKSNGFLLYVHAPDSTHLKIQVTDFRSHIWEAVRSTSQLEDLRDNIGIGGSWSDFVHYLMASIKSQDVKILVETHGSEFAKLVAQKSKGMPRISFSLTKLVGSAAIDANAFISMELFKAFKRLQHLCGQEQDCSSKLTKAVAPQDENNASSTKRHKSETTTFSTDKAAQDHGPTKRATRVVSSYNNNKRAKVRGAVLQDDDNDD